MTENLHKQNLMEGKKIDPQMSHEFDFEQWARAVRPQLISALRGNFACGSPAQTPSQHRHPGMMKK